MRLPFDSVPIELPRAEIELARQMGNELEQAYKRLGGQTYTKLARANRFFYGYLGEFAATRYLAELGVRFKHEPDTSQLKPDDGDIHVTLNGQPKVIDVKAAELPTHCHVMQPIIKRERHVERRADTILACRLHCESIVELIGLIPGRDFDKLSVERTPADGLRPGVLAVSFVLPYTKLTHPVSALSCLDKIGNDGSPAERAREIAAASERLTTAAALPEIVPAQ